MFMRVRSMISNRTFTHNPLSTISRLFCALLASSASNTNECNIHTYLFTTPPRPKHTYPIYCRNLSSSLSSSPSVLYNHPIQNATKSERARASCYFCFVFDIHVALGPFDSVSFTGVTILLSQSVFRVLVGKVTVQHTADIPLLGSQRTEPIHIAVVNRIQKSQHKDATSSTNNLKPILLCIYN